MNDKDIVYLETRSQRWKGRWHAMSRIARMGIVSTIFGGIGLLTCWLPTSVPFLSLPFSVVGLLIGTVAFLVGFYHNLRRDGFWFPLFGSVLSMLGLSIGLAGWNQTLDRRELEEQQQHQAAMDQARDRLVGRWLGDSGEQQSLQMTAAGSLLWSSPEATGDAESTIARYQFRDDFLIISYGERGPQASRSIVRYLADTSSDNRLLLSDRRVVSGQAMIDLSGVWKRVGPPRALTESERAIDDYREKRERFQQQHDEIAVLLDKFQLQREALLEKLRPYQNGLEKDDRWSVWARELNTLRDQIQLLQERKPRLQQAIVRLESAISHLTRQTEMDQSGLSRGQLEELMLTREQLDEKLRAMETSQAVEDVILQQTVQEELDKVPAEK